jgi:hypothetical protein
MTESARRIAMALDSMIPVRRGGPLRCMNRRLPGTA